MWLNLPGGPKGRCQTALHIWHVLLPAAWLRAGLSRMVATSHVWLLKCGWLNLRCAVNIEYTGV